jgi:alpha-glucosidase
MDIKSIITTAMLAVVATGGAAQTVKSPDGKIAITFKNGKTGSTYSVNVDGAPLIAPSRLGIVGEGWSMPANAKSKVSYSSVDEIWTQPWGENKTNRNNYNEMAVRLTSGKSALTIRFRAFDDGIGFRYELNASGVDSIRVTDELTEFAFADNGTSWSIPSNFETYELEFRELGLSEVADSNTPFTFKTDGGVYGSIHEAALYDWPEMNLRRNTDGVLKAELAPMPSGEKAVIPAKFVTPWRSIQIGHSAVDLINSALVLNLNEPCKIADTSWIKPQKYVGIWWGMHLGTQTWTMGERHGATTENAYKYIDFAAKNNLDGVLFEGWNEGWDNWGKTQHFEYAKAYDDFDIAAIARYAKGHNIQLWAHNETGGNIPEYEQELEKAYSYYRDLGIHTVKTGYAGGFKGGYLHHSQYGVKHYQHVVETAAKYQLMVDAHEPIKDTGIRRTWPNMMTREGARGMEWNAWSKGNSADYLCTLPFVRLLSGPMDYTPGIFDIDYSRAKADEGRIEWNGPNGDCCIKTTIARQIANWVIIYSPLQMAADLIENYEGHPAFQFFRDYNADCDKSKALQGEIGKYIVVMRQAGDRYYLGGGTNHEAREVKVSLDFLPAGKKYRMIEYADSQADNDPESYIITERKVSSADTLTTKMNANGGFAVTFLPAE